MDVDAKLQAFLWILGSAGFFATLGSAFGAVTGALYWRSGRTSGTGLGLYFAGQLERTARRESTRAEKGALVGAVDGFLFLGAVGVTVGAVAAYRVHPPSSLLWPLAQAGLYLGGAAVGFGFLAIAMVRNGVWAIAPACIAGLVGAFLGARLSGETGLMLGAILGLAVGGVIPFLALRPSEPAAADAVSDASERRALPPDDRRDR
jgi:hypothetical protein